MGEAVGRFSGKVLSFSDADFCASLRGVSLDSVEELTRILTVRGAPEPVYVHAAAPIAPRLRFFGHRKGDEILADTRALNASQGSGNYRVPGTSLELINFAPCPQCGRLHSMADLETYYGAPKRDRSMSRADQMRRDTRAMCAECGCFFHPSLVTVDGDPASESQFLCRIQTADAIERYYQWEHRRSVLTREPSNRLKSQEGGAIANDVALADLKGRPGLIANLLQYTPTKLAVTLIMGTNALRRDPLFGAVFPLSAA